jgi:P-type Cu+ transporter
VTFGRMSLRLRFWIAAAGAVVVALLSAAHPHVGGHGYTDMWVWRLKLAELVLAGLAVFGCGMPLFMESVRSLRAHRFGAVVLLCTAAAAAYAYGLLAIFAPGLFPAEMRESTGVSPHFEAAVVVVAVALWLGRAIKEEGA